MNLPTTNLPKMNLRYDEFFLNPHFAKRHWSVCVCVCVCVFVQAWTLLNKMNAVAQAAGFISPITVVIQAKDKNPLKFSVRLTARRARMTLNVTSGSICDFRSWSEIFSSIFVSKPGLEHPEYQTISPKSVRWNVC